jgi:hypothetical protein
MGSVAFHIFTHKKGLDPRSGRQNGLNRNNKRGKKNKKYKRPSNPNKVGNP